MNIYNSKSGMFESSVTSQSEMQSCKLNESESKSNITLKKIGQELDIAETKCFTLKSELNYMMGVCRKAQIEKKESKGAPDILQEPITSSDRNPTLTSPVERHNYNGEITAVNQTPSCNILERIQNAGQHAEDNFDTFRLSLTSAQLSPRRSIDGDGRTESFREQERKGLLNVAITPRPQFDKKLPAAITTMPDPNETAEVGVHDYAEREYNKPLSCFPEYMRDHLRSMLNMRGSIEELASKADEDYFRSMSDSAEGDVGNPRLNPDASDTAKARRAERSKARTEKSETNSLKANDAIPKARRRKGKLRGSASRSTVATRDTNFIGRKETKKRRHRASHGVIHQQSTLPKHLKKSNDVVEIFHNTTLKSSNSGVSSKHSKLDRRAKHVKKQYLPEETPNRKIREKLSSERVNHEYQIQNKENKTNFPPDMFNYESNTGVIAENIQEQNKPESHSADPCPPVQCEARQCEHVALDGYDDPMFTPSYGMPTLASRLKRSNRSYMNRFHFRNIPFVVGTSVTPSHNLGLNIQQVLSVMKTRHPMTNDITPLLIRKVSRGAKPMSVLLKQMNCEKPDVLDVATQMAEIRNTGENRTVNQDKKLSAPDLQRAGKAQSSANVPSVSGNTRATAERDSSSKQFCKKKCDSSGPRIKPRSSSAVSKSDVPASARSRQGNSETSLNKENIGDHKVRVSGAPNSKEIRDILINLHDQFEKMNAKYEKLQSEVEKTNDKSLAKELSALEKELNVKEEEISAVVGLYREVMTLKQQMKMLHEKNSLVCITTELARESRKNPSPMSIAAGRSHSMNPTQIFARRKVHGVTREPSTSMQLAVLLRQIQTFHKKLQLVS